MDRRTAVPQAVVAPHVFVSSTSAASSSHVVAPLALQGTNVWVSCQHRDEEDVLGQTSDAIDQAGAVLVLLSPEFERDQVGLMEVAYAKRTKKRMAFARAVPGCDSSAKWMRDLVGNVAVLDAVSPAQAASVARHTAALVLGSIELPRPVAPPPGAPRVFLSCTPYVSLRATRTTGRFPATDALLVRCDHRAILLQGHGRACFGVLLSGFRSRRVDFGRTRQHGRDCERN